MYVIACLTFALKGSRILKSISKMMDSFCFILQCLTIIKHYFLDHRVNKVCKEVESQDIIIYYFVIENFSIRQLAP